MNLPGFTAEASLYSRSGKYSAATNFRADEGPLHAQLLLWPPGIPGKDWCIVGCVCVTQENCPCCDWNVFRWPGTVIFA
jgi:hypothetical protein